MQCGIEVSAGVSALSCAISARDQRVLIRCLFVICDSLEPFKTRLHDFVRWRALWSGQANVRPLASAYEFLWRPRAGVDRVMPGHQL